MAEIFEITNYQYYSFSSRDSGAKSVAICTGNAGKTVYVHFRGAADSLSEATQIDADRFILYYRESELQTIIDMLRNEKPVYLIYQPDGTNNSRISTGSEPVGEGELP